MFANSELTFQLLLYPPHRFFLNSISEEGHQKGCEEGSQKEMTEDRQGDLTSDSISGEPGLSVIPVNNGSDKQIALIQNACDCAAKQYDDYYKSFAALDAKAQYTATVSAFVLASIVALINGRRLDPLLSSKCIGTYFLILSPPTFALTAVILSLIATKVQDVAIPYGSLDQIREADQLADLTIEEISPSHVLDYFRARLDYWKEALADIEQAVERKAKWVLVSQVLMAASLTLLLLLFVAMVLRSSQS